MLKRDGGSVCPSEQQMMSRPVSAVGYRRPLSHHARMAMMLRPDARYKVSPHHTDPVPPWHQDQPVTAPLRVDVLCFYN